MIKIDIRECQMYGLKRNLPTRSDLKHIFFKNLFRVRSIFNFENFSLILKKKGFYLNCDHFSDSYWWTRIFLACKKGNKIPNEYVHFNLILIKNLSTKFDRSLTSSSSESMSSNIKVGLKSNQYTI